MSRESERDSESYESSERYKSSESERVTFEPRHENKSCSACRDRVNERVKVVKVFQNIPGSQLLSDIDIFSWEPAL